MRISLLPPTALLLLLLLQTTPPSFASPNPTPAGTLASYRFLTDVTNQTLFDLDIQQYDTACNGGDVNAALMVYVNGEHSYDVNHWNTLQGLSTQTPTSMKLEPFFQMYTGYYGSITYANDFIMAALQSGKPFNDASLPSTYRFEVAKTAALILNVLMWTVHEASEAVLMCLNGQENDELGNVFSFDESVAFYAGHSVGSLGVSTGYSLFSLVQNTCGQFGTCSPDTNQAVLNTDMMEMFAAASVAGSERECDSMELLIRHSMVPHLTVVIVQQFLLAVQQADPAIQCPACSTNRVKESARLWTYATALFPLIAHCEGGDGIVALIQANAQPAAYTSNPRSTMKDGATRLVNAVRSTYRECLLISCDQVGGTTAVPACTDAVEMRSTSDAFVLAGYFFESDVTNQTLLDLDVRDFNSLCDAGNANQALSLYKNGKYSWQGDVPRTLQSLSLDAPTDMKDEMIYMLYQTYYKSSTYADTFITSALLNSDAFVSLPVPYRMEAAKAGVLALSMWMEVVHELSEAVVGCDAGSVMSDGENVYDIDEAAAYYLGSSVGTDGTGVGFFLYTLANTACKVMGTCSSDNSGIANVNALVVESLGALIVASKTLECGNMMDTIAATMRPMLYVLLVQNFLIAAEETCTPSCTTAGDRPQLAGRTWAYASALLPLISSCPNGASVVQVIQTNTNPTAFMSHIFMKDSLDTVATELRSVYACFQISCQDVGGTTGLPACEDGGATTASYDQTVAGYRLRTDVTEQMNIDLDIDQFKQFLEKLSFADAFAVYTTGIFSNMPDGTKRTLRYLSTSATTTMTAEVNFQLYAKYYGQPAYADAFVTSALDGTGDFLSLPAELRAEAALLAVQTQTLWMYVIHEMWQAAHDCTTGLSVDPTDRASSWDEAVGYYMGINIDAMGTGSGDMLYSLADDMCGEFQTCDETGLAEVNEQLVGFFCSGQSSCLLFDCHAIGESIARVVKQMTVPLIQGTLKYAYLSDPQINCTSCVDPIARGTEKGALWAFTASILPQVAACDANVALTLQRNANVSVGMTKMMKDGHLAILKALQGIYPCLGVSCDDIGQLNPSQPACVDPDLTKGGDLCPTIVQSSHSRLNGGDIAGIVIFVLIMFALTACCFYRRGKRVGQESGLNGHLDHMHDFAQLDKQRPNNGLQGGGGGFEMNAGGGGGSGGGLGVGIAHSDGRFGASVGEQIEVV